MTSIRFGSTHLLVAATLSLGALVACSGDGGDEPDTPGSTSSASPESPDDGSATPTTPPATLEADVGGIATCVSRNPGPELVVLYDPTATARGDLTLTGAHVTGTNATLVAAEGVIVTTRRRAGPGGHIGSVWPVEDRRLGKTTDVSTRQQLRGMALTDGQRVLPLLRIRVRNDAALDSLDLSYTDPGGNEGSVALPLSARFSSGEC